MEGARERSALVGSGPFMPRKVLATARAVLRSARAATDEGGSFEQRDEEMRRLA
jgi:hypothetical protein